MKTICLFIGLAAALTGPPSVAAAQDPEDLSVCKAIEIDIDRLRCYDSFVNGLEPADSSSGVAEGPANTLDLDAGKWVVENSVDPMSDAATLLAILEADQGGNIYRRPALVVRCQKRSSEIFVAWNEYLADNSDVTVRFGDDKPSTFRWESSADNTATFLPAARKDWFYQTAMSVDRIVMQVSPYNSGPITAVFDVRGMEDMLSDNFDLCGIAKG
jgi:hypothetical protein